MLTDDTHTATNDRLTSLRNEIKRLTADYYAEAYAERPFVPGESPVPVAGRVFDADDMQHLADATLDFWLTAGRFAEQLEKDLAAALGTRYAMLCNSGSSANLLALSALTSPRLRERQLQPGDEVITVAAGFPTTVNPIVQNGLVPVFTDIELLTCNMDTAQLEAALGPRTRAIMLAHTLGNPYDVATVKAFAREHNLWLVEDNCDAFGSRYNGKLTGTFGDLATMSFYPAHHITMGEGGAVFTSTPLLKTLVESFRDWGRDCWCPPGHQDTCGKRFGWQLGEMPDGYDHKYLYSHIGYNLKLTDMQAAVGVSQLKKLPQFIEARKRNWAYLRAGMADLDDVFVLPEPAPNSEPSWFGFMLSLREGLPFTRDALVRHFESRKIATRMLFGGNLTRQPAYQGRDYRVAGPLTNTDYVMTRGFWIGVYPGLTTAHLDYVLEVVHEFVAQRNTQ